jgi:hypothetical protein
MRDDDKTTTTIIPAAPGRYLGEFVGSPLKNLKRPRPLISEPLSRWRSNSVEGRMPWPQLSHGQLSLGLSRLVIYFSISFSISIYFIYSRCPGSECLTNGPIHSSCRGLARARQRFPICVASAVSLSMPL